MVAVESELRIPLTHCILYERPRGSGEDIEPEVAGLHALQAA
jgi:hypothetical protein